MLSRVFIRNALLTTSRPFTTTLSLSRRALSTVSDDPKTTSNSTPNSTPKNSDPDHTSNSTSNSNPDLNKSFDESLVKKVANLTSSLKEVNLHLQAHGIDWRSAAVIEGFGKLCATYKMLEDLVALYGVGNKVLEIGAREYLKQWFETTSMGQHNPESQDLFRHQVMNRFNVMEKLILNLSCSNRISRAPSVSGSENREAPPPPPPPPGGSENGGGSEDGDSDSKPFPPVAVLLPSVLHGKSSDSDPDEVADHDDFGLETIFPPWF